MVDNNLTIRGLVEYDRRHPIFPSIDYKNFSGRPTKYSRPGVPDPKNFVIRFDEETAVDLERQGWYITWDEPKEEGDSRIGKLRVKVDYNYKPALPKIVMVTEKTKTILSQDSISVLDGARIEKMDITIRPYNWSGGTTACLKTAFVTLEHDELEDDYADIPYSYSEGYED